MKLSLILPTYKKEDLVCTRLTELYTYLSKRGIDFELIVVIDGVVDNTKEKIEALIDENKYSRIKILVLEENMGKGYAVRYGMKRAKGDIIGFTDADRDIRLKTLEVALDRMLEGDVDVVNPSKFHPESESDMNLVRKIFSLGLHLYNKALLGLPKGVRDISCGLKLYRKEALKVLLPNLVVNRFAFDSEMFYWINRFNLSVGVVPVYLKIEAASTVANVKQITIMMKDIFRIAAQIKSAQLVTFTTKTAQNILFPLDRA